MGAVALGQLIIIYIILLKKVSQKLLKKSIAKTFEKSIAKYF